MHATTDSVSIYVSEMKVGNEADYKSPETCRKNVQSVVRMSEVSDRNGKDVQELGENVKTYYR
jgi:hypothetical protein